MNLEFLEGGETRDTVVKFGWVGVTDKEVVNDKRKRGAWSECGGGRAWGWRFRSSRVG
jgi:hypothetical protein